MKSNTAVSALLGVAVGDAVGVPFEFSKRAEMEANPAKGMIGYGTHSQPPGTWSDDTSLTLCLAESLINGYNLPDIASKFVAWKNKNYWTARGEVFDIGMTTSRAISKLHMILVRENYEELYLLKDLGDEFDNGNGSLMRILPLIFYIKGKSIEEQFSVIREVSALTHKHIRAAMSCLIYLRLAEYLINGLEKLQAYQTMRQDITQFWQQSGFPAKESAHFDRLIKSDILDVPRESLKSGGYVIEVLESAIWCFLKEDNYEATVLSVINLGHDTDTSAAIAGGLAGIYYGTHQMPEFWIVSIARMEEIIELGNQLHQKYGE